MSDPSVSSRKKRRGLSASEKYEMWISVLCGQATEREAADRHGVDRSTVISACRTAKQGARDAQLAAAKEELERLRATVTEQAVALHLHEGKARWD